MQRRLISCIWILTLTASFAASISFAETISFDDNFVQEVKNTSALTTANDLTLVFNNPPGNVMITDPQGNNPTAPGGSGGTTVTWGSGQLPSNVGPGQSGRVTFNGPRGTNIDKTKSFWTVDGAQINGALASLGQPPNITFVGGGAFADLTNPETFALTYSNIRLYVDNDLANFNTPLFITPTGQLVTGLPSIITLDPGQSAELSFGPIAPDTYQLILADAAFVSNPNDVYSVGTGAAVPEASTFNLLGIGCTALLAIALLRRCIYRHPGPASNRASLAR
jgi:hypothetical protein